MYKIKVEKYLHYTKIKVYVIRLLGIIRACKTSNFFSGLNVYIYKFFLLLDIYCPMKRFF